MLSGAAAATAAGTAAGATGAGGMWLFSYNKENFGFDAGMRFGRFMAARGFANAQVGQYREDIQGITGMTITKMDAWQSVTTLFLAVGAALSCAGRIGMHGAAPPGWYCALFSGSIFMSVMFNGVALWLSMHASLRAQCAATSLLTRKVRLPIPSTSQLDQARVFASAFERQEYRDIFRVPFMRHAEDAPQAAAAGSKPKGKKGESQEFGSTSRSTVPSWIRDEVVLDKAGGVLDEEGELHPAFEAPDHFKLLMKAQEEWRDYDVYARISMLYGVVSFLYAVTYYAVGYAIVELRGFWAMWSLPLVFLTAQALIFRLDILRTGNQRLPNAEILGHMAPYFAVAACTLEYRYYYSQAQVAVTWGLVFMAYTCHLLMALRMLDLAWPVKSPMELPEEPGKQWWPGSWAIPNGFAKNLWFITPPKKLEDGQNCLLHEMANMKTTGGGISAATCRRRKAPAPKAAPSMSEDAVAEEEVPSQFASGMRRSPDLPWRIVRVAICTACTQWLFMMLASTSEIVMGRETLLKPPGEPPWIRDTKYRAWGPNSGVIHLSSEVALPEKYRLFAASKARYSAGNSSKAVSHAAGNHSQHRRLASGQDAAVQDIIDALPMLTALADKAAAAAGAAVDAQAATAEEAPPSFMAPAPRTRDVAWPPLFEPRHLACAPHSADVVALSRRGVGSLLPASGGAPQRFALDGLDAPLAGAAWAPDGLRLVTAEGALLRCAGHGPDGAAWRCAEAGEALPMNDGAELLAAAVAEAEEGLVVALVYRHVPEVVAVFRQTAGAWHPAGELHAPRAAEGAGLHVAFSSGGRALLVTPGGGEVLRRDVAGGGAVPAVAGAAPRGVVAACEAQNGAVLRLALRRGEGGSWGPELFEE